MKEQFFKHSNTFIFIIYIPIMVKLQVEAHEETLLVILQMLSFNLSYDVAPGSEIMPCNQIDKPL